MKSLSTATGRLYLLFLVAAGIFFGLATWEAKSSVALGFWVFAVIGAAGLAIFEAGAAARSSASVLRIATLVGVIVVSFYALNLAMVTTYSNFSLIPRNPTFWLLPLAAIVWGLRQWRIP